MKAIATADIHLDINNRFEDTKAVLRQMATYAVNNKVDYVLVLGDIYNKKRPYNSEKVVFAKFVKYLAGNNIQVYIIPGNHDTDKEGSHAIEDMGVFNLPNIRVLENPTILPFGNSRLFLGHFLVTGAKLGPLDYSGRSSITVKHILAKYKADLYLLGDVHKAQKLHENPDIVYVGSPERITFGERKEKKGFTLIEEMFYPVENEDNRVELNYKFIPLNTRQMIQFDIENYEEWIISDIQSVKNAIIKVNIKCSKEQYNTINEEDIRDKLEGAHFIKFEYDIIRENRIRNEKINESKTTIQTFKEYAKINEFSQDTLELGLKLIEEAK